MRYSGCDMIAGPARTGRTVRFVPRLRLGDRLVAWVFMGVAITSTGLLFYANLATYRHYTGLVWLLVLVTIAVEAIRLVQAVTLFVFALWARDPIPLVPQGSPRIAVLTTIVPGKEPFDLVARTLLAMRRLRHPDGTRMDVWLLDEGNDPTIRQWCVAHGVRHFSRRGHPEWNTASGEFRARTKHGNHNAWRAANERHYDIVAQMDPDHLPSRNFLLRTLGYFNDPDVGFVVAPQVYGNIADNWIAHGAAFQAYVFHGVIQRGGNGLGAPLLIGTNHLYRTAAFRRIKGYQDSIIEDHLTAMVLYSARNPATGRPWRGVYTPDILAVGEGPTSFTDYFNQQKRWAYGIWQILLGHSPGALWRLRPAQALAFVMLQLFYPLMAVSWVLSTLSTAVVIMLARTASDTAIVPFALSFWVVSVASCVGMFWWLRKFNLVAHERRDWGLQGMALLIMCIPVYTSAAIQALLHRPLTYAVTAKGVLASPDTWRTFRSHFAWLAVNLLLVVPLWWLGVDSMLLVVVWVAIHVIMLVAPLAIHWRQVRL